MAIELKDHRWQIKPDKGLALQIARKQLPELVYDAIQLEGINFSFPEVKTLLDVVSIG